MQSTARVMNHPIHPMIIPYPFAFLSGAAVFDAFAARTGDERLAQTGRHLNQAGLAMALVAAVPGLIDYLTTVPQGEPKDTATKHLISNVSALACFAAAAGVREADGPPTKTVVGLELLGTALLSIGGWLGGTLAYRHQIGVHPEEERHIEATTQTSEYAEVAASYPA